MPTWMVVTKQADALPEITDDYPLKDIYKTIVHVSTQVADGYNGVRNRRENIESHFCHSVGVARGVSLEPIGRVDDAHLFFASRILTGMFLHILEYKSLITAWQVAAPKPPSRPTTSGKAAQSPSVINRP